MNSIIVIYIIVTLTLYQINGHKNSKISLAVRNKYRNDETTSSQTIMFPDSIEENYDSSSFQRRQIDNNNKNNENVIPLEMLEKINTVKNASQFFDELIDHESMDSREISINRFNDEHIERNPGVVAKPAKCEPENTIVPLEPLNPSKDPTVIYFPSCTRVKRCSGCCSSPLLSCKPITTKTIAFLVYKSQYTGGNKMAYRGKEVILVDQHEECKCDCKIKESDCNVYQVYEASQCKCLCSNFDEQSKCLSQSDKIWDSNNCRCRCRIQGNCTTGTFFDEHQCQCLPVPGLFQSEVTSPPFFDRRKFILKAIPVDPANDTRYNTEK